MSGGAEQARGGGRRPPSSRSRSRRASAGRAGEVGRPARRLLANRAGIRGPMATTRRRWRRSARLQRRDGLAHAGMWLTGGARGASWRSGTRKTRKGCRRCVRDLQGPSRAPPNPSRPRRRASRAPGVRPIRPRAGGTRRGGARPSRRPGIASSSTAGRSPGTRRQSRTCATRRRRTARRSSGLRGAACSRRRGSGCRADARGTSGPERAGAREAGERASGAASRPGS